MKKVLASVQQVFIQLGFVITGADSPLETFRVVEWGLVVDHLIEAFLSMGEKLVVLDYGRERLYTEEREESQGASRAAEEITCVGYHH
jgi:hypothetical protein